MFRKRKSWNLEGIVDGIGTGKRQILEREKAEG